MISEARRRIVEIEKRLKNASPGPWKYSDVGGGFSHNQAYDIDGPDHNSIVSSAYGANFGGIDNENDAEFIAHSRADIEFLLNLIRQRGVV